MLGRSSVHNRLKLERQSYFRSIGYTQGWGHFHISDTLFAELRAYPRKRKHGIKKIIPAKADLAEAYRTLAYGREAEAVVKRELAKLNGAKVPVPPDLKKRVENYLRRHPATRWDAAVAAIVRGKA